MTETMTTSSNHVAFFLPVNPIPASRPRVSKWGTYYGKRYSTWRKDAARALAKLTGPDTYECPLRVTLVHVVKSPKVTKRQYPVGDVDNYDKAVMDAITSHTTLWNDDDQVIALHSSKLFAAPDDTPGCYIQIEPLQTKTLKDKVKKFFNHIWQ